MGLPWFYPTIVGTKGTGMDLPPQGTKPPSNPPHEGCPGFTPRGATKAWVGFTPRRHHTLTDYPLGLPHAWAPMGLPWIYTP